MKIFDTMTDKYYWLWREEKKKTQEEQGDLAKRVTELNNSLSIALEINDNYQRENKKLKEKVSAAEGETSIVKGIGLNSPEMKALRKEIEKLKADLARTKEDHQYDNLVHQKELKDLRKK